MSEFILWPPENSGFSLVELSIVLVILGLLTGGILGGQSLIRAAELRSVATEYNDYTTALNTFRDKYFALPGDMQNAVAFWGQSGNCPGLSTQGTTDGSTCNGNGNGRMEPTDDLDGSSGENPDSQEWFRAWQHLANAGLLEGTYQGVGGPESDHHAVLGWNVPKSKLSGAGWSFGYYSNSPGLSGDDGWYAIDYGHQFSFGAPHGEWETIGPILTPEEAWNIDAKIDDGQPGKGKVIAINIGICTLSGDRFGADTGSYRLQETGKACALIFRHLVE